MIEFAYRLIVALFVWGTMFVVATIVVAIALLLIIVAVLTGLVMPTKSIRGQLAALILNGHELANEIDALRPS